LLPHLRAHRVAQSAARLAAGELWEDWDLVFAQPNGRPIQPRHDWEAWKALLASAGVRDARLHDARHTAATLLLEQGVDIRVVQEPRPLDAGRHEAVHARHGQAGAGRRNADGPGTVGLTADDAQLQPQLQPRRPVLAPLPAV
jgi:hypothetical protein